MSNKDSLEIINILIIDILQQAYRVNEKYHKSFLPPTPGWYLINSLEPVILNSRSYYTEESFSRGVSIRDFTEIKTDILDADGDVVIPAYIMRKQRRYLKDKPNLPVHALKLIKIAIDEYISDVTIYNDFNAELYLPHILNNDGVSLYKDGYFDPFYSVFFSAIEQFIDRDQSNIYFTELKSMDLVINKSVDFRIYDWEQKMESGEWT